VEASDERRFVVVVNEEQQHSIWDAARDLPPGWSATGFEGTREACLGEVERVWTDMRPLSARRDDPA
jgi:MbtH protein